MTVYCGDCGSKTHLEWERHRFASACFRVCDHCGTRISQTATGRMTCSDPNLQNIPIRTEEGKRIRDAFIGVDFANGPDRAVAQVFEIREDGEVRPIGDALGKMLGFTGGGIRGACHLCGNAFNECEC